MCYNGNMKNKHYGKPSDIIGKVAIGMIILLMVGVAGYVAWQFYNMPEYATDREMNMLAKDYYENYFYDMFVNNLGDNSLTKAMGQYDEKGMDPVKLRQLLLFDNGRHADSREIFSSKSYPCDTNLSYVKYHPFAPYGKTDYTYEIKMSCKKH